MNLLQMSVNILLPVRPAAQDAIHRLIDGTDWQTALSSIDTLHFLSLALLPQRIGDDNAQRLLVEANFDGNRPTLLMALWQSLSAPMRELLSHCDVQVPSDGDGFVALMQAHDHGEGTAHIALPGMDLRSIRSSVLLYESVQTVANAIDDTTLDAAAICTVIAQDARVQTALFDTPKEWPGERIRNALPSIAFVFSAVLTLCIVGSTRLQALAQGDFPLPQSVFLNITLALYVAAIPVALLAVLVSALNRVPSTADVEEFIIPVILIGYVFVLTLFALRAFAAPTLALAADVWIMLIAIASLITLAKVPIIPLQVIDQKAMLLTLLIYLLLPVPVSATWQLIALGIVLILLTLACTLSVMLCLLQRQESRDYESPPLWEPGPVRDAITAFEASRANSHNHLISVTEIKPGFLRWFAIRIVLLNVKLLAKLQGTRGELSGIVTIHFARWLLVNKEQAQLIFSTNYGGNWGSYLDEFIDHASGGLTSIWSNTVGFPRSAWLEEGGAALAERFKLFARRSQIPTLYHYSAYPALTVDQIEKNLRLNQLIAKEQRSTEECEELLRML